MNQRINYTIELTNMAMKNLQHDSGVAYTINTFKICVMVLVLFSVELRSISHCCSSTIFGESAIGTISSIHLPCLISCPLPFFKQKLKILFNIPICCYTYTALHLFHLSIVLLLSFNPQAAMLTLPRYVGT